MMTAINEAWATLSDPTRRTRYDAQMRRQAAAASAAASAAQTAASRPTQPAPARPAAQPVMRTDRAAGQPSPVASAGSSSSAGYSAGASAGSAERASGPGVLDFGRYSGWSLSELGRHDPDYLLWLERTPIGRPFRNEIQRVLDVRQGSQAASAAATAAALSSRPSGGRWFR